mmetsp:Transcript_40244/g.101856  ORF Transcript_40244/g.101856 Transcript_40244/m.101856 type:complete len:220 (-) Transcript_40244:659-1318(-)
MVPAALCAAARSALAQPSTAFSGGPLVGTSAGAASAGRAPASPDGGALGSKGAGAGAGGCSEMAARRRSAARRSLRSNRAAHAVPSAVSLGTTAGRTYLFGCSIWPRYRWLDGGRGDGEATHVAQPPSRGPDHSVGCALWQRRDLCTWNGLWARRHWQPCGGQHGEAQSPRDDVLRQHVVPKARVPALSLHHGGQLPVAHGGARKGDAADGRAPRRRVP